MTRIDATMANISAQDTASRRAARRHLEQLIMPHWALGRIMDLAQDLAGMTRSQRPPVSRKALVVMAADHGVVAQGVSKYPAEVTGQMVRSFARGGASINALSNVCGAGVTVIDLGVASNLRAVTDDARLLDRKIAPGTADMTRGPAMSRSQAIAAVEAGIDVANTLAHDVDVFGIGEMGIGNTTSAAAMAACFMQQPPASLTGRGTGIDDAQWKHKVQIIEKALAVNQPDPTDALDVLAKVGGFELGGIAGFILGAAAKRKPVVIDGFPCSAGAMAAQRLCPDAADYLIAAHRSAEPGHRLVQDALGWRPLLDLDMRLGEGTGAALAMPLIDAAVAVLTNVDTFTEAAVSEASS